MWCVVCCVPQLAAHGIGGLEEEARALEDQPHNHEQDGAGVAKVDTSTGGAHDVAQEEDTSINGSPHLRVNAEQPIENPIEQPIEHPIEHPVEAAPQAVTEESSRTPDADISSSYAGFVTVSEMDLDYDEEVELNDEDAEDYQDEEPMSADEER
jgi:hypothetical protein